MNLVKITGKLKAQIQIFSGILSENLPKVAGRFVEETIYGIQSKQSVRLSEIARALNEKIPIIKTINRLSFQLGREELWEKVTAGILRLVRGSVRDDTLLIVDISDISKPYAKKMEYLGRVRDGSSDSITDGYWTCQVIAGETGKSQIMPLYNRLYSIDASDCTGENDEIKKAIGMVSKAIDNKGVWVIDRGGDRRILLDYLLSNNNRFIIRMKGDRHLVYRREKIITKDLANRCFLPYSEVIVREDKDKEKIYHISFGFCRVRLPDAPVPLYLVVACGFGSEPMMLLTSLPMKKNRNLLLNIIKSYITRWKIEETIRFIKQSYDLEDIRVQSYRRLQNMMALVLATAYFASVYIGSKLKMRVLSAILMRLSKRIFGIPDFKYYAITDGIKELLSRNMKGPLRLLPQWVPKNQLSLFSH